MISVNQNVIFLASARARCQCGHYIAPHPAELRRKAAASFSIATCDGCGSSICGGASSEVADLAIEGACLLCGAACGPGDAWASDEEGYVCSACLDALHSSSGLMP